MGKVVETTERNIAYTKTQQKTRTQKKNKVSIDTEGKTAEKKTEKSRKESSNSIKKLGYE